MTSNVNSNMYVDPREWRTDSFGQPLPSIALADDREDGRSRPFLVTEQDLARMRSAARWFVDSNPYARGILRDLTNFVIGEGFKYNVGTKEGAPQRLQAVVQDVVNEFLDDNDWPGDLEREIFRRSRRDGECFSRLHHVGGGRTRVRIIEPQYVTEPSNPRGLEEYLAARHPGLTDWFQPFSWSFGVQTPEHDVEQVLGWFVQWSPGGADWEYVPHLELEHIRTEDADRNIKRGQSDFFAGEEWLHRTTRLLRNVLSGATYQASIAGVTQYESGVAKTDVSTMASGKSDRTQKRLTPNGVRLTETEFAADGRIVHAPSGRTYLHGPMGTPQGPVYLQVLQAGLRALGRNWSMPEHMVSGDASNNNYASILEAGTPFHRAVRSSQRYYVTRFLRIVWKAVRIAQQAGRFDRWVSSYRQLERLIEIQAEPPTVEIRNRREETERRALLHDRGILSSRTWAAEEGYDPELEVKSAE